MTINLCRPSVPEQQVVIDQGHEAEELVVLFVLISADFETIGKLKGT
jgi:hypothetical protein